MPKRIFDIIPPEEIGNVRTDTEACFDLSKTRATEVYVNVKNPKNKKLGGFFKWIFLVIIGIGIIGAILIPAKAEVKIYPKTEEVTITETIFVNTKITDSDFEAKIIPGEIFSEDQSYVQSFPATGNSENSPKAKGKIRVYSKYTPAETLTLRSGTHFLSNPKELSYHSLAVINIPAATVSGSKVTPGFVDIIIEADESGEEYNLETATFSVPKLADTSYYETTWAETITSISGGTSSTTKIVTKKDLDTAKELFKADSLEKALNSLKNKISEQYIIFEDLLNQEISNLTVLAKEKDEIPNFDVKGDVSSNIIVFKESDLKSLGEKLIFNASESEVKELVPDSISCDILESQQQEDSEQLELKISCTAKTYWLPDNDFLIKSMEGKGKDYSASILNSLSDVSRAEIKIWPFWKSNVPNNSENIEIKINFE